MLFQIRPSSDGQWSIVDENDCVVFTGTPRACEDWLDRRENRERGAGLLGRLLQRVFRRGDRNPQSEPRGVDEVL